MNTIMPHLQYITKGIKRAESEKPETGELVKLPKTTQKYYSNSSRCGKRVSDIFFRIGVMTVPPTNLVE